MAECRPSYWGLTAALYILCGGTVTAAGDWAMPLTAASSATSEPATEVGLSAAGFLASSQEDSLAPGAFGYQPGEERRYTLGPQEVLRRGELADWSIKLREVRGSGPDRVAVFDLWHERAEVLLGSFDPSQAIFFIVEMSGELTVNLHGFPLALKFTQREIITGQAPYDSPRRTVRFEFVDGKFEKRVHLGEREWDFEIPIAKQRYLDLSVPRGMYLYQPTTLECMGHDSSYGRRDYLEPSCNEADPAFTNPGLLSLALPSLFEHAEDKREFLFFTPEGISMSPYGLMNVSNWIRRERDMIRTRQAYFDHINLTLGVSTSVEVGPRKMHSWEVDVGGPVRKVYVDPDGTVLRVDIGRHRMSSGDRWIRMRHPFEY